MAPKTSRGAQLKEDITKKLASTMSSNSQLTPDEAMRKVTIDMLANNPFVPPTGCPVNDLPPELLAYIFLVGAEMEAEYEYEDEEEEEEYMDEFDLRDAWTDEEDEGDFNKLPAGRSGKVKAGKAVEKRDADAMDVDGKVEEEQEERVLPFQVLVSHVCKHWRDVAVESPGLWTTLTFSEGSPFDKSRTWIQRSKGLPLHIHIDCTTPEEEEPDMLIEAFHTTDQPDHAAQEITPTINAATHGRQYAEEHRDCRHPLPPLSLLDLNVILNIIVPHVARWQSLEVTASVYEYMHLLLSRLVECPAAPILEVLELYHYEECEDYETFRPVELRDPFLIFHGNAPKLRDVALWGVHLDWDRSLSFLTTLRDLELTYHAKDVRPSYATFKQMVASPEIRTLSLCLSGPQEHDEETNDWGTEPIEIPSLMDLVLCYHEAQYAIALAQKLSVPNVHSLALDFDGEDYSEFVKQLARPMPKSKKSILAGLEHMKISGLPCDKQSIDTMYEQLTGLKTINLNCSGEEEEQLFERLMKPPPNKLYCPNLHTITTTGIDGANMRAFIDARKAAGVPIKRVMMSEEDEVEEKDEKWLRTHVEELDFFEPSDSEEEYVDLTEDESENEMDV